MKFAATALVLSLIAVRLPAQEKPNEGPTEEKAQKTYREALDYVRHRMTLTALDGFKKADKQDGGHCVACQRKVVEYAIQVGDWKSAEIAAEEIVEEAQEPKAVAVAHYDFGVVLFREGLNRHKDDPFRRAHEEMGKALEVAPNFPDAIFADGRALANLKQDDAAKACFKQFLKITSDDSPKRRRALRYIEEPELARARIAPSFTVITLEGQTISIEDLQGKVVLIDFWPTWCEPCRAALPHVREIARKFQGQPLVVLSINVDNQEQTWREFVAKNEMTWPQYFDGGVRGPVSTLFAVHAIPHTFTVDVDGVLQDERIGDAGIEGKLKILVKRAQEQEVQPAEHFPLKDEKSKH